MVHRDELEHAHHRERSERQRQRMCDEEMVAPLDVLGLDWRRVTVVCASGRVEACVE